MTVAYGCCAGSWDKLNRYVVPSVRDRSLMVLWNQVSISEAYNKILDAHRGRDLDALILLHDDLEITDPAAEDKFVEVLRYDSVAIAGVCGGAARAGLAWWDAEPIGHQMIDTGLIDFGPRRGEVESLEGSVMAFSPWAIEKLRFDERFVGFHGYDHIGMRARRGGRRCAVVDVDTHHHTVVGFKSPESQAAWEHANTLFRSEYL